MCMLCAKGSNGSRSRRAVEPQPFPIAVSLRHHRRHLASVFPFTRLPAADSEGHQVVDANRHLESGRDEPDRLGWSNPFQ